MAGNLEDILKQGECIPEELLLAYLDAKLPAHEMHLVEKHLLECALCSDALEGLRILQSGRAKEIVADLNTRIDARAASLKNTGARIVPFRKYYPIAAVIALFILFGGAYLYLQNRNEEKTLAQNASAPEVTAMDSVAAQIGPARDEAMKPAEPVEQGPHFSLSKNESEAGSGAVRQETKDQLADAATSKTEDVKEYKAISSTAEEVAVSEDAGRTATAPAEPAMNATGAMDKRNIEVAGKPTVAEQEAILARRSQARKKDDSGLFQQQSDSLSPAALFSLANRNYEQKNYSVAAPYYEQLAADSSSRYYDEAKWLLANCYMRIHKNVKAKKLLKEIADSDSPYNRKAHGLLQELQ